MKHSKIAPCLLCSASLVLIFAALGCAAEQNPTAHMPTLETILQAETETAPPAVSTETTEPLSMPAESLCPADRYVMQQYHDRHVIPDRLNTGLSDPEACTIRLEKETVYPQYGGIHFRQDYEGSMYIDFGHPNHRYLEGEILFENVDFRTDFPGYTGAGNGNYYFGKGLTIKYKNCQFSTWYVREFDTERPLRFEFEDCTFQRIDGCNILMKRCYLGGGDVDPMRPGVHFYAHDCYISDISHKTPIQGNTHLDGMQTLTCQDLYMHNCRWEVPEINYSVNAGGFSYAVYLEPLRRWGYSGKNAVLSHCHINGGGYYAISSTADAKPEDNIRMIEPFIGAGYRKAPFYPAFDGMGNPIARICENPRFHDSLYVSSVWKDEEGILHFLASNDTYENRRLTVVTDQGEETFPLKKTYKFYDAPVDTLEFSDYPIDLEFTLEAKDPQYVIFYDGRRQIRFVNFGHCPVEKP